MCNTGFACGQRRTMLPAGYCYIPENCLYQPVTACLTTVHGFTIFFLATDSHNADLARRLILKSTYWMQAVSGERH